MALQYALSTGDELFGVAFGFLTSGYGWGGNIGVYKVGHVQTYRLFRRPCWTSSFCRSAATHFLTTRLPSQGNPYIYGSFNAVSPDALVIPPYQLQSTPTPPVWMSNVLIGAVGVLDTDTLQVCANAGGHTAPLGFKAGLCFMQGWLFS